MSIPSPQKLLSEFGLSPKHSFGQNFLSDPNLTAKLAALAAPDAGTCVLEIGAGLGALTDALLERGCWVTAVERDRDLVPALGRIFETQVASGHLVILEGDAKTLDWNSALEAVRARAGQTAQRPVVSGNLPYQITGPLLRKTVELGGRIARAVYLVQKEVADRLVATENSKEYGALTVFVRAQFQVERALVIKAGAFVPKPRVDSAVVVLTPSEGPACPETPAFREVVKAAFSARRKTLRNAWKGVLPSEILSEAAESCGIDLNVRGETLSVREFSAFAERVSFLREQQSSSEQHSSTEQHSGSDQHSGER